MLTYTVAALLGAAFGAAFVLAAGRLRGGQDGEQLALFSAWCMLISAVLAGVVLLAVLTVMAPTALMAGASALLALAILTRFLRRRGRRGAAQ